MSVFVKKILFIFSVCFNSYAFIFLVLCVIVDVHCLKHDVGYLGYHYDYSVFDDRESIDGKRMPSIDCDRFLNFDDYVVVKKVYDDSETMRKWNMRSNAETGSFSDLSVHENAMVVGNTYYYIIDKRHNKQIGPLEYKNCVAVCSDLGLRLF